MHGPTHGVLADAMAAGWCPFAGCKAVVDQCVAHVPVVTRRVCREGEVIMPYDVRIIRSSEFMRLDAEGHFDLAATRQLFYDVIWVCARSKIGRVLVDIRDATADLTAAQLRTLADVCREVSAPSDAHKIALLNRPKDDFDRAAFLADMTQGDGWNIMAFREFEEAFEWLNS